MLRTAQRDCISPGTPRRKRRRSRRLSAAGTVLKDRAGQAPTCSTNTMPCGWMRQRAHFGGVCVCRVRTALCRTRTFRGRPGRHVRAGFADKGDARARAHGGRSVRFSAACCRILAGKRRGHRVSLFGEPAGAAAGHRGDVFARFAKRSRCSERFRYYKTDLERRSCTD